MRTILLAVALLTIAVGTGLAEPRALKSWDFETGIDQWMTADQQAQRSGRER